MWNMINEVLDERAKIYDNMAVNRIFNNPNYWLGAAGGCREASIILSKLIETGYIKIIENKEIDNEIVNSILPKELELNRTQ